MTDTDKHRDRIIYAFEGKLSQKGWKPGAGRSWHKGIYCIEFDDVGFWLWRDRTRVNGKAWDSLSSSYLTSGVVWFRNRLRLAL